MKEFVFFAGLTAVFAPGASACWSCDGMTQEECGRRIKAGQEKTVLDMVAKNHEFCDGKSEGLHKNYLGRQIGQVSTDPQVLLHCSGDGNKGWVVADYDGVGRQPIEFYPLGASRDSCAGPQDCLTEKRKVAELIAGATSRHPNTSLYFYTYSGLGEGAKRWIHLHGGNVNGNAASSSVSQLGLVSSGQNVQVQAGP